MIYLIKIMKKEEQIAIELTSNREAAFGIKKAIDLTDEYHCIVNESNEIEKEM